MIDTHICAHATLNAVQAHQNDWTGLQNELPALETRDRTWAWLLQHELRASMASAPALTCVSSSQLDDLLG